MVDGNWDVVAGKKQEHDHLVPARVPEPGQEGVQRRHHLELINKR
jgi:hypothetical protein